MEVENQTEVCLRTFKKHWAEAQIDGPSQTVARYDDVAKLLITIGGFVLAVLAAMLREIPGAMTTSRTRIASAFVFGFMAAFFVCAALTCYRTPGMWAQQILDCPNDQALESYMKDWCHDMKQVIRTKTRLLKFATASFIISFLLMILMLLRLL